MPVPPEIRGQKYISLTTFRKTGLAVPTPVWFGEENDKLYVMTRSDMGKFKRIRNNPQVKIAACTIRGKVTGREFAATARILSRTSSQPPDAPLIGNTGPLAFLLFGIALTPISRSRSSDLHQHRYFDFLKSFPGIPPSDFLCLEGWRRCGVGTSLLTFSVPTSTIFYSATHPFRRINGNKSRYQRVRTDWTQRTAGIAD